jgi:hypothetical protein
LSQKDKRVNRVEKPKPKTNTVSKSKGKKENCKSHRKHLAEMGEEDSKVSHFTRKAAHACI